MSKSRSKAEQAGRWAEGFAALALQLVGYVIVARRARNKGGEIDLIARRGKVLAFIEVKHRSTSADPAQILTPRQMQRIVVGANAWCGARPWTTAYAWRYDLVIVQPWRWPKHVPDAWRPINDPALERQALERRAKGGNVRPTSMRHR